LTGKERQAGDEDIFVLHKTVNEDNPPCFIWTTAQDTIVPPLEVIEYAKAYLNAQKRVEFHMWPTGEHGRATCDGRTNENYADYCRANKWLELSARFIEEIK
jgi:acetyl esterase/lipase